MKLMLIWGSCSVFNLFMENQYFNFDNKDGCSFSDIFNSND